MRITESILTLLPISAAAARFKAADTAGSDRLAGIALHNVAQDSGNAPSKRQYRPHGPAPDSYSSDRPCTVETASIRREWDTLCPDEKRAYIKAVQCLLEKPSISGDLVPGARSRYDDFLGTHINQTLTIHGTGNFLSWHRYFTWTYEQALRKECGYKGVFPYLNWPKYALDLLNAPVFDGSDTSMSGNGEWDPRNNGTWVPNEQAKNIKIPAGSGGGCVKTGPFANMTVRLGPVAPALSYATPNPQKDGLGYNPRCLRRDMSAYAAEKWANDDQIVDLLSNSSDLLTFQNTLQGNFPAGFLGAHTAGHFIVGGDPGGDLFTSAGDPYFFLQHAQIDRVWWIWQNQCPGRIDIIAGQTQFGVPNSTYTTLDDVIELGVNAKGIKIKDAVDTLKGPFCYIYE
ncbi:Tyrosinase-like protein orsC [Pseudocercospora fuligena]|uniref:Tyrosinase-like protein orsC n=1 Tax=Pseudocercospora fuligena TaxID=685502 RepID=A0A8H6RUP2_9PEZI|nr:Tyrosinase-like protein orsC [Pseudocercospora fuligena]